MPHHSSRDWRARLTDNAGNARIGMLAVLVVLLAGGLYTYSYFRFNSKLRGFAAALNEHVLDTAGYATVKQEKVMEKTKAQALKYGLKRVQVFVTVLPKPKYQELGAYHKKKVLRGFPHASTRRPVNAPGCNTQDATDPNFNVRSLAKSAHGGKAAHVKLTDRVKGIVNKDGKAVLTGESSQTESNTAKVIILAVDVLAKVKIGLIRGKIWIHKRCYFFEGRRGFEKSNAFDAE